MTQDTPDLETTAQEIKSRGYWEVVIRPLKFNEKRLESLKACSDLVLENKVRLRGWDYPHLSSKYDVVSGDSWVENVTNWAEIEAGMAVAGLQLQANAVGLNWKKLILSNPDELKYRALFNLESAEQQINKLANNLTNLAKNERLSLKSQLVPILMFYLE